MVSIVAKANFVGGRLLATLGLGAALMMALVVPGQVEAEDVSSPRIKSMAISVLPEYDQPRVLVSYQGDIVGATMPLALSIRLPAGAEVRHACSLAPPDNGHICQSFATRPESDSTVLEYEIPYPSFYVEYDYGSVSGSGARSLDFTFWPPLAVDMLQLWVQEPLGATDFTLSPDATNLVDGGGFRHHGYDLQGLSPDEAFTLQMTYSRQDSRPSVAVGGPASTAAGEDGNRRLLVVLGVLAAGLLAVVAYARISRGRWVPRPVQVSERAPVGETGEGEASFCTDCGRPLRTHFRFCPGCGRLAYSSVGQDMK